MTEEQEKILAIVVLCHMTHHVITFLIATENTDWFLSSVSKETAKPCTKITPIPRGRQR